ncbi:hypothetical protein HH1059_03400 [Halorhodospira halochloris]|uniref:Thymidylate kinase-like domain-containing protein n=1 Tax=Halorhodospira halochloris TaxID=1052 RepID=A0A0X8X7N5_HALHR|nr:hypothetical protein [Halorhodospira halochloris]MBK1652891.1 hypothetical protein [Halorhodospira halochloris]BAU57019.1 hypothetical protein HH1059_03400 [Halorhodospira halochloris]
MNHNTQHLTSSADHPVSILRAALDSNLKHVSLLRYKPLTAEEAETGDYDLIVDPRHEINFIECIFKEAKRHACLIDVCYSKNSKTKITLRKLEASVDIDVWSKVEVKKSSYGALLYVRTQELLKHINVNSQSNSSLDTNIGSLLYITHLFHKNKDISSPEVIARLQRYKTDLEKLKTKQAQLILGIVDQALSGSISEDQNNKAIKYLQDANVTPEKDWLHSAKSYIHKKRRKFLFKRRTTVIAGPDGSGKTALIFALKENFGNAFLIYKFKDLYRRNFVTKFFVRSKMKRLEIKKNIAEERLSGLVSITALIHFFFVFALRSRKKHLLLDRFFVDFNFFGLRSNMPLAYSSLSRVATFFAPKPSRIILTNCPEHIREQRKPGELRKESALEIYREYLRYSHAKKIDLVGLPTYSASNTEQDLDVLMRHDPHLLNKHIQNR